MVFLMINAKVLDPMGCDIQFNSAHSVQKDLANWMLAFLELIAGPMDQ